MPYAIRVRLYRGAVLEADTDPELPDGAPGAEVVASLEDSQHALVELCEAAHPGARLMGFGEVAMAAYGAMIRERATAPSCAYDQGYLVVHGHSAESWRAHVDIVLSR